MLKESDCCRIFSISGAEAKFLKATPLLESRL